MYILYMCTCTCIFKAYFVRKDNAVLSFIWLLIIFSISLNISRVNYNWIQIFINWSWNWTSDCCALTGPTWILLASMKGRITKFIKIIYWYWNRATRVFLHHTCKYKNQVHQVHVVQTNDKIRIRSQSLESKNFKNCSVYMMYIQIIFVANFQKIY